MGTSKANSAKKDQKGTKKSGKTAKKNDKVTKKSTKSTTKLAKASGKTAKAQAKNTKKSGQKKMDKASGKATKKTNKTTKNQKASGKATKKAPKLAKTNQKADNLVFIWFLWSVILIVVFAGFYYMVTNLNSPKKPNAIASNNQVLVLDQSGNQVIATLPFLSVNQGLGVSVDRQLVPASVGASSPPSGNSKTGDLPRCLRDCYEPANLFLLPPDYIK